MIKRKYSARSAWPEDDTAQKRQRIQLPSDVNEQPRHSSSSTKRKPISLESWLRPTKAPAILSSSPKSVVETPPSSPPSSAPQSVPESPQRFRYRKPTFSFLRRPKSAPTPLTDSLSSGNVRKPGRDTKLVQLAIDLDGRTTITCPECGMSYIPSQSDDSALHLKHHTAHVSRLSVSLEVWRAIQERACWKDAVSRECILPVTRDDKTLFKNLAERVLQAATQDLGAVAITNLQLWSATSKKEARYHIFLYLRNRKCVGLLLAQRIDSGHKVLEPPNKQDKPVLQPLEIAEERLPARIGVSRIWTKSTERKTGIATRLLEAMRTSRSLGRKAIGKSMVAFSQPTEMGTALARKWFDQQYGWLVYRD